MATVDRPGFFSFATLPTPLQPAGAYQTASLLMKIEGWLSVVGLAFLALFSVIVLIVAAVAGTIGAGLLAQAPPPFSLLGGLGVVALVAIVLGILLIGLAISLAFLYWLSWIYAKWTIRDPRAVQHLQMYAIVSTVLSGLGTLSALATADFFSLLTSGGSLAIAIMMLVQCGDAELKLHFQGFRPVPHGSPA